MTLTIPEREAELVDEFSMFDNWMDRYQYLIELGRSLPEYPESGVLGVGEDDVVAVVDELLHSAKIRHR